MKTKNTQLQSGFTLFEILIVLVLLAIVTSMAIMNFGNSKTNLQRQRIAREFKIYLERARFDSVKRRAVDINEMSRVILNSPTSFSVAIDANENGIIDAADVRQIDFTQRSDAQITVLGVFNYPVTIRFNQRGQIIAKDNLGNDINPVFKICSENCGGSMPSDEDLTIISVSSSGTVAILRDGRSPFALPKPSITNTSPKFNCYVTITNSNSTPCTLY